MYCEKEILKQLYELRETQSKIAEPSEAVKYFIDYENARKEYLLAVLLNSDNSIIRRVQVSKGTVDLCDTHPREIFEKVLRYKAVAFILGHNHPSGSPIPSKDDINITHKIRRIANDLGIFMHDHIIVAKYGYTSMKEEGLI